MSLFAIIIISVKFQRELLCANFNIAAAPLYVNPLWLDQRGFIYRGAREG